MHHHLTKTSAIHIAPPSVEESTVWMMSYTHQRLAVCNDAGYIMLPLNQILFINAESNYSTLHLVNGKNILTSKTLKLWEKLIDHPYFFRCHRSYLVNTKYIDQINLNDNSLCINGQSIPISRDRKAACLICLY